MYLPIDFGLNQLLIKIFTILWLVSLGLIIYLIIRTIYRAIRGAITGAPQGGNYRSEARRACEKVTPKKAKQNTFSYED